MQQHEIMLAEPISKQNFDSNMQQMAKELSEFTNA
jgi:hypothetical protein